MKHITRTTQSDSDLACATLCETHSVGANSVPQSVTEHFWTCVDDVDREGWDSVRHADDIFMDLRLLKAIETSMTDSCRFRYVLYRDESQQPIAIAVLCTFEIDIGVLANDPWSKWLLNGLARISPSLVTYRILFCGLPLSACQSSLRFVEGVETAVILAKLDETLSRLAKQDRAKIIVFKEFADHELPRLQPLVSLGYRNADSLPTHLISLNGGSFEEYLGRLGRNSRNAVKRSLRKFAGSGMQFITTSDFVMIEKLMSPKTYALYESVLERSTTKFEHLPRAFFLEMARQLPDCCEYSFALDGNEVKGFSMGLVSGDEYYGLYMGFDETINHDTHLYFNLSLRGIENAAHHGVAIAEIGQNSEDVKRAKFGAIQSRRSIYVRGSQRWMNWVIGRFFNQLFPPRPISDSPEHATTHVDGAQPARDD
ncbi:GNAT family N-acetyltransferase [Schlesneria paludicola]|uniref:GNAT family N-acetyltransferase n=1 Tax=Schlesneria paludicola TaxID=360056 RepID=UPI0012FCDC83